MVAMVNYFNHSPSVLSSKVSIPPICRLATYGISSLDSDRSLKFLFPLEAIAGIHFYYGIPAAQLEEDKTLIKKIKDHVRDFRETAPSISYSVHATSYNDLMILCLLFSSSVQTLNDISKSL
jgi:hypothetical protein